MNETEDVLRRQCAVFTRYLLGRAPDAYVADWYVRAHGTGPVVPAAPPAFDRLLLRIAGAGPWGTRLADTWAAVFRRNAVLRRKLILLLAVLETSAATHGAVDAVDRGGRGWLVARLLGCGAVFGLVMLVAALLLGPVHVVLALGGRT